MLTVVPLGGASEIGASCFLVEAAGLSVVVDCGVRPRALPTRYPNLEGITTAPAAVIITHAHADHTGALPLLHRRFPQVPYFATAATVHLTQTMLRDSVSIMEREADSDPAFTLDDVEALSRSMVPAVFGTAFHVASSAHATITACFYRAGHILGAAMVLLEVEDRTTGRVETVFFTGDISTVPQPTIPGADIDAIRGLRPTLCLAEGTYGPTTHDPLPVQEARLIRRVAEVLARGGKVLIPAFAIGRAQNVALVLRRAFRHPARVARQVGDPGFQMPAARIYLDGMTRSISEHYANFPALLSPEAQESRHGIYDPEFVLPVSSPTQRAAILADPSPAIIIASSGMLTGGMSVEYAKALLGDPRSAIFFSGYLDEEAAGAILLGLRDAAAAARMGATEPPIIELDGSPIAVRCEVDSYGMSAHADADGIAAVLTALAPERVALVHGTPARLEGLARRLTAEWPGARPDRPVIEVAHADEPIPVHRRVPERGTRLAVTAAAGRHWATLSLLGRIARLDFEVSPVTPYLTALLTTGASQPLTDAELARAEAVLGDHEARSTADVDWARSLPALAPGLWQSVRAGAEVLHRPIVPPAPVSAGTGDARHSLAQVTTDARSAMRQQVRAQIRHLARFEEEWARLDAMGVSTSDIVLFLDVGRERTRLAAGLTLDRMKNGYRIAALGIADPDVSVHQIVSRVGPWPASEGSRGAPGLSELRIIAEMTDALPVIAARLAASRGTELGDPDGDVTWPENAERRTALYAAALHLEKSKAITRPALALHSVLLERDPTLAGVTLTVEQMTAALGGRENGVSSAITLTALEELRAVSLLGYHDAGPAVAITWPSDGSQAGEGRGASAIIATNHLGSALNGLLERALVRALESLRGHGVSFRGEHLAWATHPLGKSIARFQVESARAREALGKRLPPELLPPGDISKLA